MDMFLTCRLTFIQGSILPATLVLGWELGQSPKLNKKDTKFLFISILRQMKYHPKNFSLPKLQEQKKFIVSTVALKELLINNSLLNQMSILYNHENLTFRKMVATI